MSKLGNPQARERDDVLRRLESARSGLTRDEVARRQQEYGPNELPRKQPPGLLQVFFSQFRSPLIYVLLVAALVSLAIQEYSDAIFISAVLLLNSIIGTAQEFSAPDSFAPAHDCSSAAL